MIGLRIGRVFEHRTSDPNVSSLQLRRAQFDPERATEGVRCFTESGEREGGIVRVEEAVNNSATGVHAACHLRLGESRFLERFLKLQSNSSLEGATFHFSESAVIFEEIKE